MVYYTEKMKEYVNEIPAELRRVIYSLSNDSSIAVFLLLVKHGKQSQRQISTIFNMPDCYIEVIEQDLKYLQKSSLISSTLEDGIYYYNVTEFGERVLNNLMNIISTEG